MEGSPRIMKKKIHLIWKCNNFFLHHPWAAFHYFSTKNPTSPSLSKGKISSNLFLLIVSGSKNKLFIYLFIFLENYKKSNTAKGYFCKWNLNLNFVPLLFCSQTHLIWLQPFFPLSRRVSIL